MANNKRAKLYHYAGCSTCKKARAWLTTNDVEVELIPIVENPPSAKELNTWIEVSGVPAHKWFNSSGQSYRALIAERGKDAVAKLSIDAIATLLAADGKMIKRPILLHKGNVSIGFNSDTYLETFS